MLKANLNAIIDKWEDPKQTLERSIRDMETQVRRMRGDVVSIVAEEKKLKNQVEEYEQEIERWEKNAVLAVKEGKEDLAREALRRKRQSMEFVQQLRPQWEQQGVIANRLKQEYHQLRNRIEDARRKKRRLTLRLRQAQTQKRLQGLLTELSDNRVFEQLEHKVADMEALNAAEQELQTDSLEQKFDALSTDMDVEQELDALKERMELTP